MGLEFLNVKTWSDVQESPTAAALCAYFISLWQRSWLCRRAEGKKRCSRAIDCDVSP